jgi:putative transposase
LAVVDEYSPEALAIEVDQRIRAQRVIAERGAPQYVRSDNGPEYVAQAVRAWLKQSEIGPVHIEPGKPWQNGVAESFIGKLRDECLSVEWFYSPAEARVVVEIYRKRYNRERPHSSLGYATPAEVRASEKLKEPRDQENPECLTLVLAR